MELKGNQRSYLSKTAHSLKPVVMIGGGGLTDGVIGAVKEALECHELIKVRFIEHKENRKEIAVEMAEKSHAELVRIIGNVVVLYKEAYDPDSRRIVIPN